MALSAEQKLALVESIKGYDATRVGRGDAFKRARAAAVPAAAAGTLAHRETELAVAR